jgi:hypothetical protein
MNAVVHDDNVNSTNAVLHGADNISDATATAFSKTGH